NRSAHVFQTISKPFRVHPFPSTWDRATSSRTKPKLPTRYLDPNRYLESPTPFSTRSKLPTLRLGRTMGAADWQPADTILDKAEAAYPTARPAETTKVGGQNSNRPPSRHHSHQHSPAYPMLLQIKTHQAAEAALLVFLNPTPYYPLAKQEQVVGEIEAKDGLPSADRNNKATLLLTGPFRTAKSSAKDLTPLVLKLQYAKYHDALRAPWRNRLLRR
ncbi:hypothetical protein FLONG3_4052, partial [Fusarium longipes]